MQASPLAILEQNGKKDKIVHLPKTGAIILENTMLKYNMRDEETIARLLIPLPQKKKIMILKISGATTGTLARLIVRSGIIPPKAKGEAIKYYIDLPLLSKADQDLQTKNIKKIQTLFRDALSRRRRSLLLATCMAFQPRLGTDSILSQMDGSGALMHQLIAPHILKDA